MACLNNIFSSFDVNSLLNINRGIENPQGYRYWSLNSAGLLLFINSPGSERQQPLITYYQLDIALRSSQVNAPPIQGAYITPQIVRDMQRPPSFTGDSR